MGAVEDLGGTAWSDFDFPWTSLATVEGDGGGEAEDKRAIQEATATVQASDSSRGHGT